MCGTLVVAYLLRDSFTDRAQIVSYMLLLLEVYLLDNFMHTKKKRNVFFIFLISVLICNMHVAIWPMMIVLVLPYLGEYVFSLYAIDNVVKRAVKRQEKKLEESIKQDKNFLENYKPRENTKITITKNDNAQFLLLIIVVILFGGIFTPTGTFPYTYTIKAYMGNATSYINEHLPIVIASSVEFLVVIIFTIACIGFTDSKMTASDAFLLLGLYFMTIRSRRHLILLTLLRKSNTN